MKAEIHPKNYRMVVFKDLSCDYSFLTKSSIETKDTVVWEDGNEYPLVKLEISHKSHPFYTGKLKLVDTAGIFFNRETMDISFIESEWSIGNLNIKFNICIYFFRPTY